MINRNNQGNDSNNLNLTGGMSLISYIRRMFENNINSDEESTLLLRNSYNYNRLIRMFENSESRNFEENEWERIENFVANREENHEEISNESQDNFENNEDNDDNEDNEEDEENRGIIIY